MPSQQLWASSAGVPTVESYTLRAFREDDIRYRSDWNYPRRGIKASKDPYGWDTRWPPRSTMFGGNPEAQEAVWDFARSFEPHSCDGPGTQTSNFIIGRVADEANNSVAGAVVQGFRTSDDAFVGQVESNVDGHYVLPTFNANNVAHYLVAYIPGSPDRAGTTVNTLIPTKVDGTA
jgi:hypothetical protein